jgi:hypothetical protein
MDERARLEHVVEEEGKDKEGGRHTKGTRTKGQNIKGKATEQCHVFVWRE